MKRSIKTGEFMEEAPGADASRAPADNPFPGDIAEHTDNKEFFEALFRDAKRGIYLNADDKAVWAQVARTVQPLRSKLEDERLAREAAGRNLSSRKQSRISGRSGAEIRLPAQGAHQSPIGSGEQAMIAAIRLGDLDLLSALVAEEKKARKAALRAQDGQPAYTASVPAADAPAAPIVMPEVKPAAPQGRIGAFDRGEYRKLARGQMPIEGRLDLHGYTQDEAHYALQYFVQNAQARGRRHLLVITGKGHSLGSAGVLQKLVPHWLAAPALRIYIAAIEPAARAHGGSGAFYIRLRRG